MEAPRREFIHFLVSAAISGTFFGLLKAGNAKALPRPPASLVEDDFRKACARCYRCIDACPAGALRPASLTEGLVNFGTPVLEPSNCIFCMECVRACPTGAITKIPKEEVDIGNAVIDQDTCLAWQKKKRCKDCYRACDAKAIKLKKRRYPVVIPERCNGCGACVRRCPTQPLSIRVAYEDPKRYPATEKRIALRPEDRIGPYEFEQDDFMTWFGKRLEKIARNHGMGGKKETEQ